MPVTSRCRPRALEVTFAIDIGNSRLKTASFNRKTLVSTRAMRWSEPWQAALEADLTACGPRRTGISSVAPERQEEVRALLDRLTDAPIFDVHHRVVLPFSVTYRTPQTLGADRLAAAAAAWHHLGPHQSVIVVDAGTALTIDVITQGAFQGGIIGAGPSLESRMLVRGTAALPPVHLSQPPEPVGSSTEEALQAGILYGLIDRVCGHVRRLARSLDQPVAVAVTGGWLPMICQHLEGTVHADPHLVLRGVSLLMSMNPP